MSNEMILKEYFIRYMRDVRKLSETSIRHYLDALQSISRYLKEMNFVRENVYEIIDIDELDRVRALLYNDTGFAVKNERGNNMYSAGLNNYLRFANGEGFEMIKDSVTALDFCVSLGEKKVVEREQWKRSSILCKQTIEMAGYCCEINEKHDSFIAESIRKRYMEGHHAVPMRLQENFCVSLDVYANIVSLCPICHRKIHYGLKEDRVNLMGMIYEKRSERLVQSGIRLSKEEFCEIIYL